MSSHARPSLESSLRRSARLGQEVLERATRRAVDWTNPGASPSQPTYNHAVIPKTSAELTDVYATMADLMVQMSHQCQRLSESGCCSEASDAERKHASRFHTQPAADVKTPSPYAQPTKKQETAEAEDDQHHLSPSDEDFLIDVWPGTYAVTASLQDSEPQTQVVTVKPGESFQLTFNL